MVVMILHNWNILIFISLFVQMATSMTLDYLLVSQKVANLDVTGVAISSIGTSFLVLIVNLTCCWFKLEFRPRFSIPNLDFSWFKRWSRVGAFSALDSFIRNIVYLVVVIRAMNQLDEQDSYWVTNTFIWSWLLLPAMPLMDLLKQDVSRSDQEPLKHWIKTSAYVVVAFIIFILWACTYPIWDEFLIHVMNAKQPDLVMDLATILTPCYAFFVIGSLMNSVFYAFGRTEFLAMSSFTVNLLLVILFLLMIYEVIPSTVYVVAGIFGFGLAFGAFVTGGFYTYFVRKTPLF